VTRQGHTSCEFKGHRFGPPLMIVKVPPRRGTKRTPCGVPLAPRLGVIGGPSRLLDRLLPPNRCDGEPTGSRWACQRSFWAKRRISETPRPENHL